MKVTRLVYFLSHIILVLLGSLVAIASGSVSSEWQKSLLFAVGTSIVAAGLCGMVVWVYLATTQEGVDRLKVLDTSGLDWIYPSRAAQIRSEYANRLQRANSSIDIIGFGLKDFKRDYLMDLEELSRRAKIRILLLDPNSPYGAQRDLEENQSEGVIKSEVSEFVKAFKARYEDGSDRMQLRLYSSLPEVNIFRIDDEIFWGPYLAGRASGNTITLRVKRGGYAFEALASHFDRVWNDFSRSA